MPLSNLRPLGLTARELRSLRRLRIPRSLRRQVEQCHVGSGYPRRGLLDMTWRAALGLSRSLSSRKGPPPVLEGKQVFRLGENPKAILALGEDIAFVHIPGLGTEWRAPSQSCFEATPKGFLVLLLLRLSTAFPAIVPRKLRKKVVWSCCVPQPPPLCEQRKWKEFGLSRQMMKVVGFAPSIYQNSEVPESSEHVSQTSTPSQD